MPHHFKFLVFFLAAAATCMSSCESDNDAGKPNPQIPVNDVLTVSRMSSDFGWELFKEEARGKSEENVLLSPISIQTALSMAVNGADGETLKEMLKVLACEDCSVQDLNTQTAKLRELMEEQSGSAALISANGFFYDPSRVSVYSSFVDALTENYRAGFAEYDFDDPSTKDKINAWVSQHTNGKIDGIIENIDPMNIAFLINALHFKADWATGFATESTYSGTFKTGDGRDVQVNYVNADRNFTFTENTDYALVDVPFRDSTYSLSFVQAKSPAASGWVENLTSDELKAMWSSTQYGRAILTFPRLDLSYDQSMINTLKALGMEKAFSEGGADFSQLGQPLIGPNIFISEVRHKAVLKVDEKGAEGAAVTSVGFSTTSLPPSFTYDRPFVLVLRHIPTNALLFAGLVNDPS